jgi:hypothetical protein
MMGSGDLIGSRDSMRGGVLSIHKWNLERILMTHVILAAQIMLICTALLVPQDFLKQHSHHFYLIHYLLFLPFFFTSRDRCALLFSPSFLIISYVSVSFVIGGFAFAHGYVLWPQDLVDFHRWNHFNAATAYFMTCNLCAAAAYSWARRRWQGTFFCRTGGSLRAYTPELIVGGMLFVTFSLVRLRLDFWGGGGSFSIGPRIFGAIVICMVLAKARSRHRFLIYLGLLLLFAASQYNNRRNILLLGLSVIFMEVAHLQHLRLSWRRVVTCLVVVTLALVLQLTMTIARGVQGFKGSYWQTFGRIENFIKLSNVTTLSLKQTEGPTIFFHSNNALNYVLDDPSLLTYGSTLARPLFLLIPRSIWPDKPKSMTKIYIFHWNPEWANMGISTGINLYAEYFWNLYVLGLLCVAPILYFFNRCFFFYLDRVRAGTVWPFIYLGVGYNFVLIYARGQGLDLFAAHTILGLVVQLLVFNPLTAILRVQGGKVGPYGVIDTGPSPDWEGECSL